MAKSGNIVVMGLLLSFTLVAAAADKPQDTADAKAKIIPLSQVTKELSDEAEQALKEHKPLPRTASDYAKTHGDAELSSRDLMTGLTRPADRNPVIDAYIKWQLLSFKPDFAAMKSPELMRVIDALPSRQPSGQLDGRDLAAVKAASNGRGNTAAIQKILDQFNEEQKQIAALNKPNDVYRKAVLAAAGSDKGLELVGRMKELELMIESGEDRQVSAISKKLAEDLGALRTDPALTGAIRGELARRITQAARLNRTIVGGFSLKASGEVLFTEKTVSLNPKYAEEMQAYLMGREYTPAKKK